MTQHKIVVDNTLSVEMNIPKTLSLVELQGIMLKVKKLMSLAEISAGASYHSGKASGQWHNWTAQEEKELVQLSQLGRGKASKKLRVFAEKHSMSFYAARSKLSKLKKELK